MTMRLEVQSALMMPHRAIHLLHFPNPEHPLQSTKCPPRALLSLIPALLWPFRNLVLWCFKSWKIFRGPSCRPSSQSREQQCPVARTQHDPKMSVWAWAALVLLPRRTDNLCGRSSNPLLAQGWSALGVAVAVLQVHGLFFPLFIPLSSSVGRWKAYVTVDTVLKSWGTKCCASLRYKFVLQSC